MEASTSRRSRVSASSDTMANALDNVEKAAFNQETVSKVFIKEYPKPSISCLPTEVLEMIFMHAMPRQGTCYYMPPSEALAHWLSITHVCRYWRKVASNHKDLWTQLDFRLPKFALQMLERSNPRLIVLNFAPYAITDLFLLRQVQVLKFILESCPSRIGSLSVDMNYGDHLDDALGAFTGPAPNLYKLELRSFDLNKDEVPDRFLCYGAPRLKELILQNMFIPRDSALFSNLKGLTWYGIDDPGPFGLGMPSNEEFFDTLRKSPNLEALSIEGMLPFSIPDEILTLPYLRNINLNPCLSSEALISLDLFNHIVFAEKAMLMLFIPYQPSRILANAVFSFFSRYFSPASSIAKPRRINTLRIKAPDDDLPFIIMAWYDPVPSSTLLGKDFEHDPPIFIHFEYAGDSWPPFPQLMTTVAQTVPFTALETLDIRELSHQHDMLETLLRAVCWSTTLKHIYVGGLCVYRLVDMLHTGTYVSNGILTRSNGSSGSEATLPFPALETLLMTSVDFVLRDRLPLMSLMMSVFGFRLRRHAPIRKLLLRDCGNVSRADIGLLKGVVDEIDWDGKYS